ncbi:MAG: hypothetical protein SVR94_08340 [Pseudomonadota bacterium]|nr:hypothetical protein [Pseudomonadota bacterium]
MLVIRSEQVEVLELYMVEQFEARMRVHLRRVFAEELEGVSEEELREQIRLGVERARSYQIMQQSDVQRYLECMVVYGWKFDTTEWAKVILHRENWDGEMKMDEIEQHEFRLAEQ